MREPDSAIAVEPSAVLELGWVLYRIKRAWQFDQPAALCASAEPPASLTRRVAEFWSDAARNFDELFVLAQWGGALFETNPSRLFSRIPNILKTAAVQDLALSSERPDEGVAIEHRLQRLAADERLLASYLALLRAVWHFIRAEWRAVGRAAVQASCKEWRARLAEGTALTSMLPSDHAVFQIGLLPLLEAGMAKREVTVTPVYYCLRGHITDLPGVLSVGVAAIPPSVRNGYVARGRTVATYARVLANPRRVAILTFLLDTPSSVAELSGATGIAETTVRTHINALQAAGLIHVDAGSRSRYRAVEAAVDGLINEVSARIHRGHGRSSRLHAEGAARGADFRAIFDNAPIAIIQFDLRGRCLSCNSQAQDLFGYSETEMGQLRNAHLLDEKADRDVFEPFDRAMDSLRRSEVRLRRKDGSLFWGAVTVSLVCDERNVGRFTYAMVEDLSDRRGAEDALTGLPNRVIFTDQLKRMIALSARENTSFVVLILDLDGFKSVNDTLGHAAGDIVLQEVSKRLTATLRAVDMVARLGGDEFGVLAMSNDCARTALQVAEKLYDAVARPFAVNGHDVRLGVSIGVAISPDHGTAVTPLLQRADEAMYIAKRSGGGARLWQPRDVAASGHRGAVRAL